MSESIKPSADAPAPRADAALARLAALTRLTLSAVADRRDYEGEIQAGMSSVQVGIVAICDLAARINGSLSTNRRIEANSEAAHAWFLFGGVLGLLDAEAWRLVSNFPGRPPEHCIADLEDGLRHLVELLGRTQAALQTAEATPEAGHA